MTSVIYKINTMTSAPERVLPWTNNNNKNTNNNKERATEQAEQLKNKYVKNSK